jgi:hypothetical protein
MHPGRRWKLVPQLLIDRSLACQRPKINDDQTVLCDADAAPLASFLQLQWQQGGSMRSSVVLYSGNGNVVVGADDDVHGMSTIVPNQ